MGKCAISVIDDRQYRQHRHSREGGNPVCGRRHGERCLRRQVNATAGLHFTDWVLDSRLRGNEDPEVAMAEFEILDSRLRGNDGQRPSTQRLSYPLFLRVGA